MRPAKLHSHQQLSSTVPPTVGKTSKSHEIRETSPLQMAAWHTHKMYRAQLPGPPNGWHMVCGMTSQWLFWGYFPALVLPNSMLHFCEWLLQGPKSAPCGCGSKPMVPHFGVGEFTHFRTYLSGWVKSDVPWGYDLAFGWTGLLTGGRILAFDAHPWPCLHGRCRWLPPTRPGSRAGPRCRSPSPGPARGPPGHPQRPRRFRRRRRVRRFRRRKAPDRGARPGCERSWIPPS